MQTKIMITTLLAASLMLSCNPKEILEPTIDYPTFVVIDGDTVKTRDDKTKFKNNFANYESAPLSMIVGDTVLVYAESKGKVKPLKLPKLDKIKNNADPELKGKPFRLFAVGQGLLTGYRDGGLFNEGMETSLPSLLANQMGIDFNQAYFDNTDYNGFNKRVKSNFNPTGGPVPKYKFVRNNTGIELTNVDGNAILKNVNNDRIDNIAVPYFHKTTNDKNAYLSRIQASGVNSWPSSMLEKNHKADFYIIQDVFERGFNSFLNSKSPGLEAYFQAPRINGTEGYTLANGFGKPSEYNERIESFVRTKATQILKYGVILNTPDFLDFPYLNWIKVDEVKKVLTKYDGIRFNRLTDAAFVLPTSEIDSLLGSNVNVNLKKGLSIKNPLNARNFIENKDVNYFQERIPQINLETKALAKELNIALVDIYSIYKQIHKGSYVSLDGQSVTIENFYSSDGVYPSAFGQAVICNETIKAINIYYGLDIMYINSANFLQKQ